MTQLKSGVYFVRYQDITKFFQDAEKNGWKHNFDDPQANIYAGLRNNGREDKTIKQFVIPFSLDKRKRRIGYWSQHVCFESDVEETMDDWSDYGWSEKHIEVYQSKKVVL
jgi:hypothetical protein